MPTTQTALVIGGGIAGPVAASALHKAGIEARIYEAYPSPAHTIGSGLALAPNGIAALDVIDAGTAVRDIATGVPRMCLSVGGKLLPTGTLSDQPPLQLVDRKELHSVLYDCAAAAGVPVEFGKRLVAAEQTASGVTARFADGTSATADVLIGADGIRSTVRELIDPAAPGPEFTGMLGFGATVRCGIDTPPDTIVFAYGRHAYYLYWPLGDGRIGWGANLPSTEYLSSSQAREVPAERWVEILRETYGDDTPGGQLARATTPELLEVVGALHIMPPVPRWYRDRICLVGDAVHAPSNSSGQGASLAIESAIELARCLRDIPDPAAAFAAYERLRRRRVEGVAARAAKINHSKTPGPVGRRLMQWIMPIAARTVMKPEKALGAVQRYRIEWDAPVAAQHPVVS